MVLVILRTWMLKLAVTHVWRARTLYVCPRPPPSPLRYQVGSSQPMVLHGSRRANLGAWTLSHWPSYALASSSARTLVVLIQHYPCYSTSLYCVDLRHAKRYFVQVIKVKPRLNVEGLPACPLFPGLRRVLLKLRPSCWCLRPSVSFVYLVTYPKNPLRWSTKSNEGRAGQHLTRDGGPKTLCTMIQCAIWSWPGPNDGAIWPWFRSALVACRLQAAVSTINPGLRLLYGIWAVIINCSI